MSNFEYSSTTQSERKDLQTSSPIGVLSESKNNGDNGKLLEVDNNYVTVKLLQAVKIPARHCKLVRVQAKSSEVNQLMLFEEKMSENENQMISMTSCITEVDKDQNLVVTIENHGLQPVILEKGLEIGYLEPIQLVSKGNEICAVAAADGEQAQQDFPEVNHCSDELYSQLDLEVTLTEGEKGKLSLNIVMCLQKIHLSWDVLMLYSIQLILVHTHQSSNCPIEPPFLSENGLKN